MRFIRWGKGRTAALLGDFRRLLAWEARVAALGHGERLADVAPEEAIAIASESEPAPLRSGARTADVAPGDRILFRFHDANTPVLEATLLRADAHSLTVRPTQSEAGAINLHFPRTIGAITRVT
jgi:glutathione S-transferase